MHVPQNDATTVSAGPEFDYAGLEGIPDETVDGENGIREHWRVFFEHMDGLGVQEVLRRWEEARQLIRENGVTYNVYGDPQGLDRPWELDPIPLLISANDAAAIESGLIQRAHLLDAMLADLYGPQRLVREGILPPELLLRHPGFLRPCVGLPVPQGRYLHLYAADLSRVADGQFYVLRDRTQAPSGAGYALENRIVMSRMLPEVFRECRVQRLALFYRTLRDTLRSIAPVDRENPRVVLLTPGPFNETYFEHAFLARYLGYTLVEGADLTVRDGRVYLRLLGGLQQVDVILRRLDDDFCDPLELRGDSFLGVPGLLQAVRAGNVAVANSLGSGLVESPAFLGFHPAICRFLLGEDLKLPSAPTWWCGQQSALDHVLAHFDQMVIKPSFSSGRTPPVFVDALSSSEKQALAERIRRDPWKYVGQNRLQLSTTPVLVDGRLKPRHVVMRSFLAAGGESYAMMPGGFTRVSSVENSLVVSMQSGSGSKDTWMLTAGPISNFTLLSEPRTPAEVRRDGGDLPSRAADDLFWLGRYAERTDSITRLLRAIFVRLTERPGLIEVPDLPSLLRALTHQTKTYPGFVAQDSEETLLRPIEELTSLLFDRLRVGGLASTIESLHSVAHRVRDRISIDMWRIILSLESRPGEVIETRERSRKEPPPPSIADLSETLNNLDITVTSLAAFGGMVAESMTRGQGWRFLDIGRRLERSLHLISLLRSTLVMSLPGEPTVLEALLEIADSSMTYRRRYMSRLQTGPLLDLLLHDEDNPRSLAYQFEAIARNISRLPRLDSGQGICPEEKLINECNDRLKAADVTELARVDQTGYRADLERLLVMLQAELPLLSESLTRTYLTHLQASRQYHAYTI